MSKSDTIDDTRRLSARLEALMQVSGSAFVSIAELQRRLGRLEEARATLDEGLARDPDRCSGHVVRIRVLKDLGEREGALAAAAAARELDPDNSEVGRLLAEQSVPSVGAEEAEGPDPSRATRSAEGDATDRDEDSPFSIETLTLAALYLRQGYRQKAEETYRRILARNPLGEIAQECVAALEHLAGEDASTSAQPVAGPAATEPARAEGSAVDRSSEPSAASKPGGPADARTILVVNGPNLAALGKREPETYGSLSLDSVNGEIAELGRELGLNVKFFQSNSEGELVDEIEESREDVDGIIINPGGLTHTSVVLRDALVGSGLPFVEVHISNTAGREPFRRKSLVSAKAVGVVYGFGVRGYLLALRGLDGVLRADDPPTHRTR